LSRVGSQEKVARKKDIMYLEDPTRGIEWLKELQSSILIARTACYL
jgi:hypothetical protein